MQDPRDDESSTAELAPGAVRRERILDVPREQAWDLMKDAEGLSRWLADEVDVVVAPGEHGHVRDAGGEPRHVSVEEVVPGHHVGLRWETVDGDLALVDLILDDLDGATRLTVTEMPLRLVAAPDVVPTSWTIDGGSQAPFAGPMALALA